MTVASTVKNASLDELIKRLHGDTVSGRAPKKLVISTSAMDRLEDEAFERLGLVRDPAVRAPSLHGVPIELEQHHEDRVRIVYADDQQREPTG